MVGVKVRAIQRWETETSVPTKRNARKLARVLLRDADAVADLNLRPHPLTE